MNPVDYNGRSVWPSKIVCVGRNYVQHIRELDNEVPEQAVIFMKPNSAISDTLYCRGNELVHYEAEITFLIWSGRLAAVGFGLDLTRRELQTQLKQKGLPWERAKAFDGSAVFSDFVDFDGNELELGLQLTINGNIVQQASCAQMLHKPEQLLAEISDFLSLEDGDLLMTGTPAGVGPLRADDCYTGRILSGQRVIVEQQWQARVRK